MRFIDGLKKGMVIVGDKDKAIGLHELFHIKNHSQPVLKHWYAARTRPMGLSGTFNHEPRRSR